MFDRWEGVEVVFSYSSSELENSNKYIDWDRNQTDGKSLPSDTYYFIALVRFSTFRQNLREATFKNWIKLIRLPISDQLETELKI